MGDGRFVCVGRESVWGLKCLEGEELASDDL